MGIHRGTERVIEGDRAPTDAGEHGQQAFLIKIYWATLGQQDLLTARVTSITNAQTSVPPVASVSVFRCLALADWTKELLPASESLTMLFCRVKQPISLFSTVKRMIISIHELLEEH